MKLSSLLKEIIQEAMTGEEKALKDFASKVGDTMDLYRSTRGGTYETWNGNYKGYEVTVEYFGPMKNRLFINVSGQGEDLRNRLVLKFTTDVDSFPTFDIISFQNSTEEKMGTLEADEASDLVSKIKSKADKELE